MGMTVDAWALTASSHKTCFVVVAAANAVVIAVVLALGTIDR